MGWARLAILAAAMAFGLAGCDRDAVESKAPEPAPTPVAQAETAPPLPAPSAPAAPTPIPPSTELPVSSVDSVMLSTPEDAAGGLIIRVLGTAASTGWTFPKLAPMNGSGGDSSVMSYSFVAISPETSDDTNKAQERIETELRVQPLPAEIKTIRIVSATNEISAPVAQ